MIDTGTYAAWSDRTLGNQERAVSDNPPVPITHFSGIRNASAEAGRATIPSYQRLTAGKA